MVCCKVGTTEVTMQDDVPAMELRYILETLRFKYGCIRSVEVKIEGEYWFECRVITEEGWEIYDYSLRKVEDGNGRDLQRQSF